MAELRAVPKPEGHDITLRRAEAAEDCTKWLPENAMYEVYEDLKKKSPVRALIITWYDENPDGSLRLRVVQWNEHGNESRALSAELFTYMNAPR